MVNVGHRLFLQRKKDIIITIKHKTMSIKQLKKCFLLTAVALLCAFSSNAQETFERGKLYHIYGAGESENLVAEKMGE